MGASTSPGEFSASLEERISFFSKGISVPFIKTNTHLAAAAAAAVIINDIDTGMRLWAHLSTLNNPRERIIERFLPRRSLSPESTLTSSSSNWDAHEARPRGRLRP